MWSQIHVCFNIYIYIYISKFCIGLFGVGKDLFHDVWYMFQFVQSKRPAKPGRKNFDTEMKFFVRSLNGATIYLQYLTVDDHSSICFLSLKYATPNCTILFWIYFLANFQFSSRPSHDFLSCSIKHNLAHSWREFIAFDVSILRFYIHTHKLNIYIFFIYIGCINFQ